jgi:hypothetical protein
LQAPDVRVSSRSFICDQPGRLCRAFRCRERPPDSQRESPARFFGARAVGGGEGGKAHQRAHGKASKRTGDALPQRVAEVIETGTALVTEAKGLGRAR